MRWLLQCRCMQSSLAFSTSSGSGVAPTTTCVEGVLANTQRVRRPCRATHVMRRRRTWPAAAAATKGKASCLHGRLPTTRHTRCWERRCAGVELPD